MIVNFNRSSPIMVNEINHVRGLLLENQKKKKIMKILIILLPFKQHFYHRFDSLFKKEKFRSVEIFSLQ